MFSVMTLGKTDGLLNRTLPPGFGQPWLASSSSEEPMRFGCDVLVLSESRTRPVRSDVSAHRSRDRSPVTA
jgi:hypothetical protein